MEKKQSPSLPKKLYELLARIRRALPKEDLAFLEESFEKALEISALIEVCEGSTWSERLCELNTAFVDWDFTEFLLRAEQILNRRNDKRHKEDYSTLGRFVAGIREDFGLEEGESPYYCERNLNYVCHHLFQN